MSTTSVREEQISAALERAFHPDGVVIRDDRREVRLCAGTACHASGRVAVREAFTEELAERGIADVAPSSRRAATASATRGRSSSSSRRGSSIRA